MSIYRDKEIDDEDQESQIIEHINYLSQFHLNNNNNNTNNNNNNNWSNEDNLEYTKNQEQFYKLCKNGPLNQLKQLVRNNNNNNCIELNLPCYLCDYNGSTGLILATKYKKNSIAAYLLQLRDINVNHRDLFGYNALKYAVENDMVDIVSLLIELNSEIDLLNTYEPTAFNSFSGIRKQDLIIPIKIGLLRRYLRHELISGIALTIKYNINTKNHHHNMLLHTCNDVINIIMDYILVK
jgi:hypothetical protein